MPIVIDVADAVVSALNVGTFTKAFKARRCYRPTEDLATFSGVAVVVVPQAVTMEAFSRGGTQYEVEISVIVQRKLPTSTDAEMNEMVSLVDEISSALKFKRLAAYTAAFCAKAELAPLYVPEHVDKLSQFTGVLTLTFRVFS